MTPERVLIDEPGADHRCRFAYYGGVADGRVSVIRTMAESELATISDGAEMFTYTVTRYGVHADNGTLCWVLFMHTPIQERGKL